MEIRNAVGKLNFWNSSPLTAKEKFPLALFRHHVPLSIGSRAELGAGGRHRKHEDWL